MLPKLVVPLMLVLCLGLASCTKIEEGGVAQGSVGSAITPFTDAVPKDYGRFVGVSSLDDQGLTALWFERPDGTITTVSVNVLQRKMLTEVAVVERR